mgnify:FL=1|jgi:hypothetical protein
MDPGLVVTDAWGKTEEARQPMKAVGNGHADGAANGIVDIGRKARHS